MQVCYKPENQHVQNRCIAISKGNTILKRNENTRDEKSNTSKEMIKHIQYTKQTEVSGKNGKGIKEE